MMRFIVAAGLLASSAIAGAQASDFRAGRMRDILSALQTKVEPATVFGPGFLAAVSPAQLATLIRDLEAQHGKLLTAESFVAVTPTSGRFTLRFERATASASFAIEGAPPHRVTGLRITSITPIGDSKEKIAADFAALPGRSGFVIARLDDPGPPILAAHADTQFAIGSTFKLWVLDAVAEDIVAGRHRWDEVVAIGPRSLPGGLTQDWPPDAPVTVETLATLMISQSDNTATDTLIHLVGRERVAERVRATGHSDPSRMLPVLTTAESFALKLSQPVQRDTYARADDAGQSGILATLDTTKLLAGDLSSLDAAPAAIDGIEWFASPMDVARVLDALRKRSDPRVLQILGVAPAMNDELRAPFAYVGYKGGSEVGVLSLSWLVRCQSGDWLAVTASWNDARAAVDPRLFGDLTQRLLRLAASDR